MLNINNPEDKVKMMQYHRTRDMINLLTYFKELSPILDLTIVKAIDDYLNNYDFCKNLTGERNDTLISRPCMESVGGKGINPDIISIFKEVKKLDPYGVMVLFNLCHKPSERYERYAGISVGISLKNKIYIDAVGKGFDGREVSKGISCHERYMIPWDKIRTCNIDNFKEYQTFLISQEEYEKSRKERINFLTQPSLNLNPEIVSQNIPQKYTEIPDFIWLKVIRNLIKKLPSMEEELESADLQEFAISGHTEGADFLPWQMFDKVRYTRGRRL